MQGLLGSGSSYTFTTQSSLTRNRCIPAEPEGLVYKCCNDARSAQELDSNPVSDLIARGSFSDLSSLYIEHRPVYLDSEVCRTVRTSRKLGK